MRVSQNWLSRSSRCLSRLQWFEKRHSKGYSEGDTQRDIQRDIIQKKTFIEIFREISKEAYSKRHRDIQKDIRGFSQYSMTHTCYQSQQSNWRIIQRISFEWISMKNFQTFITIFAVHCGDYEQLWTVITNSVCLTHFSRFWIVQADCISASFHTALRFWMPPKCIQSTNRLNHLATPRQSGSIESVECEIEDDFWRMKTNIRKCITCVDG